MCPGHNAVVRLHVLEDLELFLSSIESTGHGVVSTHIFLESGICELFVSVFMF